MISPINFPRKPQKILWSLKISIWWYADLKSNVKMKSPFRNISLATEVSSYLYLNLCKCGLISLQSRTKRDLPFLFFATVNGLTTLGILSTFDTHPLFNKFCHSFVTKSLSFKADLLLRNTTDDGSVLKEFYSQPWSIKQCFCLLHFLPIHSPLISNDQQDYNCLINCYLL